MTEKKLTPDVLAILSKPFAVEDHELRDGGRDGKLVYITEGPLLERLTEADPDWEFDVIKSDVIFPGDGPAFVRELGRLTICGVSRVSSGTGFANMQQYGYDNGKRYKLDTPVVLPLSETEAKGATTDTLKRCARLFRIGAYLLDTKGEKFQNDADFQRWYIREFGKPAAPHTLGADQPRSVTNQMADVKPKPAKSGQKADKPTAAQEKALDEAFPRDDQGRPEVPDVAHEINATEQAYEAMRAKVWPNWTASLLGKTLLDLDNMGVNIWNHFWVGCKALEYEQADVHTVLGLDSVKDWTGTLNDLLMTIVKTRPVQLDFAPPAKTAKKRAG